MEGYYRWRPNLPDEGDNHVLELAVAAGDAPSITFALIGEEILLMLSHRIHLRNGSRYLCSQRLGPVDNLAALATMPCRTRTTIVRAKGA